MFSQVPADETTKVITIASNSLQQRRKKRKNKKKNKALNNSHYLSVKDKKKNFKLSMSMSSWAENFTVAATWQLKHQLAYWKAKARALEYENNILHEVIRKNQYITSPTQSRRNEEVETVNNHLHKAEASSSFEHVEDYEEQSEGENMEVSEEFIEFLKANAKFKEDARQERERLKAKEKQNENDIVAQMEAGPSEAVDIHKENFEELYGDKWKKMKALEVSLQADYMDEDDRHKPMLWPYIPLNFNFN